MSCMTRKITNIKKNEKKKKNTTLLEQFQNRINKIVEKRQNPYPLTHKYMTAHFFGLKQALQ